MRIGSGCIDPWFLDLSTSWRCVISFTPWPLYPHGKDTWYPLYRRLGGHHSQSWWQGEVKILDPIRTTPTSRYNHYLTTTRAKLWIHSDMNTGRNVLYQGTDPIFRQRLRNLYIYITDYSEQQLIRYLNMAMAHYSWSPLFNAIHMIEMCHEVLSNTVVQQSPENKFLYDP